MCTKKDDDSPETRLNSHLEELEEEAGLVAGGVADVAVVGELQLVEVDHVVQVLVHLPNHLLRRKGGNSEKGEGVKCCGV